MNAERKLRRVHAPDEAGAEERAWAVVRSAHRERVRPSGRTSHRRPILAFAAAIAVGAVALSPAGARVGRLLTRVIAVQHPAPTLLSLPAPGRLLISGSGGTWTVSAHGSARRLGPWTQASWSPHGMYVAAGGGDQLTAADPRGDIQWTLGRPAVSDPRWYPPTGYRVAYRSGDQLRVVAGNGTGDHLLAAHVAKVAPAWRPGHPYQLAYLTSRRSVVVRDADTGQTLWSADVGAGVDQLAWSEDARHLLVLSPTRVHVYAADGATSFYLALPRDVLAVDGALSPDGHMLALTLGGSTNGAALQDLGTPHAALRRVLVGAGLDQVAWSPDGKWLLVSWPAADQWVFARVAGSPRIAAVSQIAQQFSPPARRGFPHLDGWCCTVQRAAR